MVINDVTGETVLDIFFVNFWVKILSPVFIYENLRLDYGKK